MHVSVSGIFKELNEGKETPLRSFNRVFIIVPSGSGFCIANEQLFITNCTPSQLKVTSHLIKYCITDQLKYIFAIFYIK